MASKIDPEDELWKHWPSAASVIFEIFRNNPALSAFGLDSFFRPHGGSDHISATFSRVAVKTGWGRDYCYVTARKDEHGNWSAAHSVKLDE